jgi:hypothetical protein
MPRSEPTNQRGISGFVDPSVIPYLNFTSAFYIGVNFLNKMP